MSPTLKHYLFLIVIFALCVVTHNSATFGQNQSIDRELDHFVAKWMAGTRVPGLAVGVSVRGRVVVSKGYGVSNIELGSAVNPKTVFNIASITKTFTALAAMKLAEQGRLSLDDPISKYLDTVPLAWRPVTVRQLLSNTSGIKSFTTLTENDKRCNEQQDTRTYRRGDAIKEVECLPLEFAPGEKWQYADTGFYMIGMIIEKISGRDYESFLREYVLLPLAMRDTALVDYSEIVPHRADGYSWRNEKIVNAGRFEIDEFANGGLRSTLEDMLRFEQAFLTEKILKKSSINGMLENARLNNGEIVSNYGLGLGLTPFYGQRRFGHTGGGGLGFVSAFTHFPDKKVWVVVLANADQDGIGTFANQIAQMFFGERY